MEKRFDMPDLLFGIFLCGVAAVTLIGTRDLTFGNAAEMGPSYMPRILAIMAIGFGLFFIGRGILRRVEGIETPAIRPLLGVLLSVAVFAFLAAKAGLALASFAAIAVSGLASRETRYRELVIFGVVLSAAATVLFVKGLSLPIPIWP